MGRADASDNAGSGTAHAVHVAPTSAAPACADGAVATSDERDTNPRACSLVRGLRAVPVACNDAFATNVDNATLAGVDGGED